MKLLIKKLKNKYINYFGKRFFQGRPEHNFSMAKILVYVREEKKPTKISEKKLTQFLNGQNSRICT